MNQKELLSQAFSAARAGQNLKAQRLLKEVLTSDPRNEMVWLLLSTVVESDDQRTECLERVLRITPESQTARKELHWISAQSTVPSSPKRSGIETQRSHVSYPPPAASTLNGETISPAKQQKPIKKQKVSNSAKPGILVSKEEIVGKGGPIAGSATSIIGSLLAIIGFALPWASCGSYRLSGLDIVTQSVSGNIEDSSSSLLCLVPFFAMGVLGIAIAVIPATLWKKIPEHFKTVGMALVSLLTVLACCPSCLFFTNIQSARNDPNSMGGFVQVEYGFWVTLFGLIISFVGGILGVVTSVAEKNIKEQIG